MLTAFSFKKIPNHEILNFLRKGTKFRSLEPSKGEKKHVRLEINAISRMLLLLQKNMSNYLLKVKRSKDKNKMLLGQD